MLICNRGDHCEAERSSELRAHAIGHGHIEGTRRKYRSAYREGAAAEGEARRNRPDFRPAIGRYPANCIESEGIGCADLTRG